MGWRLPLPPQVNIQLLPPLPFLTMSLHYQSRKVGIYHRILQSGRQALPHEHLPNSGWQQKEPSHPFRCLPKIPVFQFPPIFLRIQKEFAFLPLLLRQVFSEKADGRKGNVSPLRAIISSKFQSCILWEGRTQAHMCKVIQIVSHFPSYTHHLQLDRHRMQSINGTFPLDDF